MKELFTFDRDTCPRCGYTPTEFEQFGGADSETTITDENEVDGKLLELRSCDDCGSGIEIILEPDTVRYDPYE